MIGYYIVGVETSHNTNRETCLLNHWTADLAINNGNLVISAI